MDFLITDIEKNQIEIEPGVLLPLLGIPDDKLDAFTRDTISDYISECHKIMSPAGGFSWEEAIAPESNDFIEVEGEQFLIGKIISKMLRYAKYYAFFAVTAGPEIERLSRALIDQGKYLEGFIVDLIGSVTVEKAADQVHKKIKETAGSQGLRVTNRYSPGYCSWDVSEQQKLFGLIPDQCCGISLSESSLMSPIKSISGIIGVGKTVNYRDYTCEICSMKDCTFRHVGSATF